MVEVVIAKSAFDAANNLPKLAERGRFLDFISKLHADPSQPGLQLHALDGRPKVWSGRVSYDFRAILYREDGLISVLYVDHHDPAYDWANRRQIDRHPKTGVVQVVEVRETVKQVERVLETEVRPPRFADYGDDYLLSLGTPPSWMPAVREIRSDDELLQFCSELDPDVAERLIRLSAGELVTPPRPVDRSLPVARSPEMRQRFYVVDREDDLRRALEAPLEHWITFLHPSQRFLAEGDFNGPVKVSGSAGTGKTVVLLHRARFLARQGQRVLITTFVKALSRNLEKQLAKLCSPDELERITVSTVHREALRLAKLDDPKIRPVDYQQVENLLKSLQPRFAPGFSPDFARSEWEGVVQAQGINDWPGYRAASRTGRGRPLAAGERKELWGLFSELRQRLQEEHRCDWPDLCRRAESRLHRADEGFDAVLVDEVQDLSTAALRMVFALCKDPSCFMVAGDAGQRIYPGGFSLRALGIEVRGRSRILRINYRTTEQIRRLADRLLGDDTDDLDGGREARHCTRSLLRGPDPVLRGFRDSESERRNIIETVKSWQDSGLKLKEIAVFARSQSVLKPLADRLGKAGLLWRPLKDEVSEAGAGVEIGLGLGTMHSAKGLEFKAVVVAGCHASQLPNRFAVSQSQDPVDREQALIREKRLLYVAMTRARDEVLITWNGEPSPFLRDLVPEESTEG